MFALSPECSVCHKIRQLPQPHDLVALEDPAKQKLPAALRNSPLQPKPPIPGC